MPCISSFYGILIMMYFTKNEHNPPHIHAFYGEKRASFLISTGEKMNGSFPKNGQKLVKDFILKYQKELQEMWDTETYKKLPPLR